MINFKEKYKDRLGLVPSPRDDRDYKITRLVAKEIAFPQTFCRWTPPTKNQENINSCVAHAGATIKENIEKDQTGVHNFSVGFNYGYRESTDFQGQGMIPREYLNGLLKYGIPLYEDFPYNEEYPEVLMKIMPIKEQLKEKAYPYRISAYARLYTEEDIKTALMKVSSIMYCIPVYDEFFEPNEKGIVKAPNKDSRIYGYHATVLHGWTVIDNKEYWIVQNSWGNEYGCAGVCFMDKNYPFEEAWSVTDTITPKQNENNELLVDISEHWAKGYIERCVNEGLLKGYDDGTFKPDKPITRAEMAVVLTRLLDKK